MQGAVVPRTCSRRMQQWSLRIALYKRAVPAPRDPKRVGGGNRVSDGRVTLLHRLIVGTFNTRRLWHEDGSAHDGFHALSSIFEAESVSLLCVQEVHAPDFPALMTNQPLIYDGPSGSGGRDAGSLIRPGVCVKHVNTWCS